MRLVVTDHVLMCDAVIAGTVRSRHDPRRANLALVVFAGGASCAAHWMIGAVPWPSAVRFDAAGVVPNRSGEHMVAGAAASSGLRPSREVPNRLRPSPTVRVEGASCCGPQGEQLEA